jgi:two-component system OmpR family response regulator
VRRGVSPIQLTPREFELLRLLMEHAGAVLSKQQIVQQVWGYDFGGDDNIVEVYIGYLRDKLGDRPPRFIKTIRGVGYVLRDR